MAILRLIVFIQSTPLKREAETPILRLSAQLKLQLWVVGRFSVFYQQSGIFG